MLEVLLAAIILALAWQNRNLNNRLSRTEFSEGFTMAAHGIDAGYTPDTIRGHLSGITPAFTRGVNRRLSEEEE